MRFSPNKVIPTPFRTMSRSMWALLEYMDACLYSSGTFCLFTMITPIVVLIESYHLIDYPGIHSQSLPKRYDGPEFSH